MVPGVAVGESPLHVLAKGDQWWHAYEALPYLLLHRPDLEARDPQGNTPLHKALSSMGAHRPFFHNDPFFQKHAATLLVTAGADVNAVTMNGRTCPSDALATCDIELVQLLISQGARVTGRDVLAAIESLHPPALDMLLSTPKMPSEETEVSPPEPVHEHIRDYGPRALYHAAVAMHNEEPGRGAQMGREEQTQKSCKTRSSMLRTLLAHGADPLGTIRLPKYPRPWIRARHNSDDEGPLRDEPSTVLHQVLLSNGMVEPFLELPTLDLEQRNEAGQTMLLAACHNASAFSSPVSLLSPANTAPEPLITHLLRRGADPSAVDNDGLTALHSAVTSQVYFSSTEEEKAFAAQLQSLILIPALRAAINAPDKAGNNPLHHAIQAGHGDATITVLLSAGADPRSVNPVTGDNALHVLARRLGSRGAKVPVAMFERFAKLGADVNLRNAHGETPMFRAVAEADLQIRHGPPDPYGDDDDLDGARAEAMWQMFEEIGVNFAARDDRGRSLLHVAAGKVEPVWDQTVGVYEKLLKMGVDPLVLDDRERTSVDVAAACRNEAALALFEREDGRWRSDGEE
ncbi:ankyrin repeat-containing domain protein [Staphylotrichum tortipilum]|uniref:Ankyrin repeat-containing domain protein n=1 Tax=Staphylotrichum tortipilum TaxID=2831512 RepID=A0AAN6MG11_9PEZI|nr:ankyrin repeat-containing domain protein [Staphylotrichum longicolle]